MVTVIHKKNQVDNPDAWVGYAINGDAVYICVEEWFTDDLSRDYNIHNVYNVLSRFVHINKLNRW